jgi:hypothetical protein
MAAPFEAVDHSPTRYLQRRELLERILAWFGERLPGVRTAESGAALASGPGLAVRPSIVRGRPGVRLQVMGDGSAEPVRAAVYDCSGSLVRVVLARDSDLDIGRLAAGVYLLRLDQGGQSRQQKFVVTD